MTVPAIAVVLPRNMRFSPQSPTSVDSVVHQHALHSPWRDGITVYVQPLRQGDYFTDVAVKVIEPASGWPWESRQSRWLENCIEQFRRDVPDLIEVHQHIPSALALAAVFPDIPVLLVRHHALQRMNVWKRWRLRRLAGITSVSDYVRQSVRQATDFPEDRLFTAFNGLALTEVHPAAERQRLIVAAGRLRPEKGWLPLAEALVEVLPQQPGWRAVWFTLEEAGVSPAFRRRLETILQPVRDRIDWRESQPPAAVRQAMSVAEIAVTPSQVSEAFGLTALEAHAGGAALISSGVGGLHEVSGDAALYTDSAPAKLADALRQLIGSETQRQRMRQRGYERAALFDAPIASRHLQQIWQRVLDYAK